MISGSGRTAAPSNRASHRKVPAWRSGTMKVSSAPAATAERRASGSAFPAPSTPRRSSATGAGRSLRSRRSSSPPRLTRSAGAGPWSDTTCVGGRAGSRAMVSAAARKWRAWRPSAAAMRGEDGLRVAAASPAITSRRSQSRFRPRCIIDRFVMPRSGPFSGCSVQPPHYVMRSSKQAIFLLRTGRRML